MALYQLSVKLEDLQTGECTHTHHTSFPFLQEITSAFKSQQPDSLSIESVFFLVMVVSLNSCGFLWLGSSREIEEKILTNVYVCWAEYGQCV
jgi:hypothetical protein